jgi:hypothetical protein
MRPTLSKGRSLVATYCHCGCHAQPTVNLGCNHGLRATNTNHWKDVRNRVYKSAEGCENLKHFHEAFDIVIGLVVRSGSQACSNS